MSMSATLPPPTSPSEDSVDRLSAPVQTLAETEEFLQLLGEAAANGEVVVVKYYARFCRACKAVAPKFERLARQYEGVNLRFVDVEFESSKPLCKAMGIKSLPHTQVFAGSQGKVADFSIAPSKFDRLENFLARNVEGSKSFKIPVPAALFEGQPSANEWGVP